MNFGKTTVTVLGVGLLAAIASPYLLAQEKAAPEPAAPGAKPLAEPTPAPARPIADEEVRAKLRRVIPVVRFEAVEFKRAIEWLGEIAGLNIHVRWGALAMGAIDPKQPVTLRLSNVPVEKVLRIVLDDVGCGAGSGIPLVYVVDEGVITITTTVNLVESANAKDMAEAKPVRKKAAQMEHMEVALELIERMEATCFEPARAGLIAIGGLKTDVPRKPAEIIADLENQLRQTKTLGLRNAIRLTLKDLYKVQGEGEKVLEHLRAMIAENDAALQEWEEEVPWDRGGGEGF